MTNINIRKAKKSDTEQLKNLMNNYITDFYKRPEANEETLRQLINKLIDEPTTGIQFVAEKDENLVAFATLYFSFSTLQLKQVAILNDLFVSEKFRGKKIGESLFEACLKYIRDNHFAYMTWETAQDNVIAQSLYEKMGGKKSEWLVYEIS